MKHRILQFVMSAGILVLNLTQCTVNPSPTLPLLPSTPTLTPVEDFECWAAPQRKVTAPNDGMGQLIIGYSGNGTLYRRDVSTTDYSLIDSGISAYSGSLSVSPDGRYLWYTVPQAHVGDVLFIYDLLTRNKFQASFMENEWDPAVNWSADGQCLIGWHLETATAFRLSDGATQQKTFFAVPSKYNGTQAVSPSPNGRWWAWPCPGQGGVCVKASKGLRIYDPAFNLPKDVDEDSQAAYQRYLLRWSPNSDVLAFVYATRLYVADLHLRLVHFAGDKITSYQDFTQNVNDLRWSPDGRRLLIFDRYGDPRLRLYDMANQKITDLPNVNGYSEWTTPAWSPNGEQIVFVGKDERSLYIMNVDGTGLHEVPALPSDVTSNQPIRYVFWVP